MFVTEPIESPNRVKQICDLGLSGLLLVAIATLATPRAQAAGGAHIVDDSEVETPGTCHVEGWVTRFVPGEGYYNVAPACTMKSLPMVEIGANFQHYWDQTVNAPLLGPAMKVNFQSETTGVGVGLGLNGGVNVRTGDLGLASLIMLVTLPVDDKVKFNFNAGWSYLRGNTPDALFYGAQVEAKVGWDVSLMLEVFGRAPGQVGTQMGLRYTPGDGPVDIDLLAGSIFDPSSPRFFTVGVTVRF